MSLHINTLTVAAADSGRLARFWAEALGWKIILENEHEAMVAPGDDPSALPGAFPLLFEKAPDEKTAKNRLHFDLVPDDQAAEVARLEGLGARRVDIGQGDDASWVVMADPEGNELCVLRSYEPPVTAGS